MIINFPEGTRQTATKYQQSVDFAASRNMTLLTHLMFPRPKGFIATMQSMEGCLDAVVDVTIGFSEGGIPSLWQYCQGTGCRNTRIHVRRWMMEELPVDSEELLKEWIAERFREKDELLDRFYRTGSFEEGGDESGGQAKSGRDVRKVAPEYIV